MVIFPIWLLFRIIQSLGLMTSRLREPRGFVRTPKAHRDTAKWVLIYTNMARRRHKELAFKLVDGWMKSPGHRANMLNGRYRYIGVGVREQDSYIWATQNFGGL